VLLEALAGRSGVAFREAAGKPTIAVQRPEQTLSLEPGGQLELSGAAAPTARAVHAENIAHLDEVRAVASTLGMRLVTLGYRPWGTAAEMPWMPKTRYQAMRDTLGRRGALALDMMLMTATGQVSLDWESEEDCARKMTVLARMAPVLVALFANSPLVRGQPSGYLSYRSHVWTDVDAARCGFFPAMLDGRFSYRAYVEWALDAPLLFLRRSGRYVTPSLTFRTLMTEGFEGTSATLQDWQDHLSTLFPEVRMKRVLEVRSADCVSPALTGALPALLRGIAYEPSARRNAEALLPMLSFERHAERMETARRQGLRDEGLRGLATELLEVARTGLRQLDPEDLSLLEPLDEVARSGKSPAEAVLAQAKRDPNPRALLDAFTV
jgi:glutamate--cysteine ligase